MNKNKLAVIAAVGFVAVAVGAILKKFRKDEIIG